MFTPEQIQELKQYFHPVFNIVTELPAVSAVSDGIFVVLVQANVRKLYIMSEGKWMYIGTLTEA